MRVRAGCVLIEEDRLALIERRRAGEHYFTLPGGGVDPGETHEQAAIREAQEELGLQVKILRKIAEVHFKRDLQPFFLVERTGGEFGTGTGEEYGEVDSMHGTYRPLWMPLAEVLKENVLPRGMVDLIHESLRTGWPEETVIIFEESG